MSQWIEYGDSFSKFREAGLNAPGTVIDVNGVCLARCRASNEMMTANRFACEQGIFESTSGEEVSQSLSPSELPCKLPPWNTDFASASRSC